MTDKVQKIREEVQKIARSINPYIPDDEGKNSEYEAGRFAMVTKIMQIIDSMQEEPVSKDFEEALAKEWQSYIDRGTATVDALEDNTQELAFAKGFYRGAQWGKNQEEKDLELTWEDMMIIHKCCKDAMNNNLYEWHTQEGQKKIYEEVLKRFKAQKGE